MSTQAKNAPRYAPAARPVSGTTILTSTRGLETSRTTIPFRDGMTIYVAKPARGADCPVVLVTSEAFGLHEHIEDIARRFAHEGYVAVAPDLMFRQGDPMRFTDIGALVRDLLLKIPDKQVLADLDACVDWAAANGGDVNRLSTTGFCWGGRWTWLYAAHRPMRSAVAWYGIVDGKVSGLFPDAQELFSSHPIDLAPNLATPVLGLYGGKDEAISLSTVETMKERLAQGSDAARHSKIVVYLDAGHAFFADYRDTYRPREARDGWRQCLAWMSEHNAS